MNCEILTRTDTSSLYKNGRLIAQANASFRIRRCSNLDLKIHTNTFCCYNRRMLRVGLVTTNTGDSAIANGILRVTVISKCCNCCCVGNSITRIFNINNLNPGCSDNIWINLPYPCNRCYTIIGQIEVNNVLFKEDSISI